MGDDSNDGARHETGSGRRFVDDKSVVFVGGINWKAAESELLEFFNDAIGPAIHCRIIFDRDTNRSKGYGFVTFASPELARDAKTAAPPLVFMGKTLNCQSAFRRSPFVSQPWPSAAVVPSSNQSSYPYYPAMLVDQMGMVYVASSDGCCYYPSPSLAPPAYVNQQLLPQEPYFRYPATSSSNHGESRFEIRDKPRSSRSVNIAENSSTPRKEPRASHLRGERIQQTPKPPLPEGVNQDV